MQVRLSFGSSTTLAQQVAEGAPADIVALAGTTALAQLPPDAAQDGGRATIARNAMEIATPRTTPAGSRRWRTSPARASTWCSAPRPCRAAPRPTRSSPEPVTPNVVSREVDVKATLAKVRLGEADAAVVYHSDVVSAGDAVHGVAIPAARNTTLDYPMLWLNRAEHTVGFAGSWAAARAWPP